LVERGGKPWCARLRAAVLPAGYARKISFRAVTAALDGSYLPPGAI
jgi:hypothetical protein